MFTLKNLARKGLARQRLISKYPQIARTEFHFTKYFPIVK